MSKKLLGVHEVPKGSALHLGDSSGDYKYKFVVDSLSADRQMELPALSADDVFVFEAQAQSLTNKELASPKLTGTLQSGSDLVKDEDTMASDSDQHLATQQSIKAYVDAQITAQDLDIAGDSGTGAVDLDSQSLAINGGTGLTSVASGQAISIALDNTAVTADSYGGADKAVTFTVDAQGRLTAASAANISIVASQVSDFSEAVDDRMNALAQAGEAMVITYDDTSNTLTFAAELASALNPGVASFASADFVVSSAGDVSLKAGSVEFADLAGAAVQLSSESFSNDDVSLMTSAAIEDKIAADSALQDLDLAADSGTAAVLLDSQSLSIVGTANEIETVASGQQVQIGLPDNVTIGNNLTVDEVLTVGSSADAGSVVAYGPAQFNGETSIIGNQLRVRDSSANNVFTVAATDGDVVSSGSIDMAGSINMEGNLTHDGSGNFVIDSSASTGSIQIGSSSKNVVVRGDLTVQGTTVTVDSNTVNIGDNIITLNADETGTPSQDAGIEIERGTEVNKTLYWDESATEWSVGSDNFRAATFNGDLAGNADTASALETARTLTIAGDASGSASFDGSADASISISLGNGVVDTAELASDSVTTDKIVTDAVTEAEIANDAVQPEHLHDDVAGIGLGHSDSAGLYVDLQELPGTAVLNPADDQIIYLDNDDNVTKREAVSDFMGAIAGDGIQKDANSKLALDINGLASSMSSADAVDADLLPIYDDSASAVKKVSFQYLRDSMFGDVSGDATIAAGGALTIANEAVEKAMLDADLIADHDNLGAAPADSDELLLSDTGVGSAAVIEDGDTLVFTAPGQSALLVAGDFLVFSSSGSSDVVFEVDSISGSTLNISRDTSHPSSQSSGTFSWTPTAVDVQDSSGNSVSRPATIDDFSYHFSSYSMSSSTTAIYHQYTWEAISSFTATFSVGTVGDSSAVISYDSDTAPSNVSYYNLGLESSDTGPFAVSSISRNGTTESSLLSSFQYSVNEYSSTISAASGVDLNGAAAYSLKAVTIAKLREAMSSGSLQEGVGIEII